MWSTVAVSLNSTFTMSSVRVLAVAISGFSTTRLAGVQDGSNAPSAAAIRNRRFLMAGWLGL